MERDTINSLLTAGSVLALIGGIFSLIGGVIVFLFRILLGLAKDIWPFTPVHAAGFGLWLLAIFMIVIGIIVIIYSKKLRYPGHSKESSIVILVLSVISLNWLALIGGIFGIIAAVDIEAHGHYREREMPRHVRRR